MALNDVDKLALLAARKARFAMYRSQVAADRSDFVALRPPGDLDAQATALYDPILIAFDDAIARFTTMITNTTPSNAAKVAYADVAIAAAKS